MAGYIYVPIPTDEMMIEADTWRQGQKAKNKQPYEILRNRRVEGN
jgi:hypothetical protein